MKKKLIVLLVFIVSNVAGLLLVNPLIVILAKKQLGSVFKQSLVSVSGCRLRSLDTISLLGIEINRKGAYSIKVKEADLRFNMARLLKPPFVEVALKNTDVYINTPGKRSADLASYFNINTEGPQLLSSFDLAQLNLDITTKDITLKASLSLGADLRQGTGQGEFSIPELKYDKLSISDIKGKVKLKGLNLSVYEVSAALLDGKIEGELDLGFGKKIQYFLDLKCAGLDIGRFIDDFNLREKFNMTGKVSGWVKLRGRGAAFEILDGNFSALPAGGTLVISDTRFLGDMARNTGQPLDLLVESFKNYNYNTGIMTFGLENKDVVFNMELEGEAGKRSLSVVLHDFSL